MEWVAQEWVVWEALVWAAWDMAICHLHLLEEDMADTVVLDAMAVTAVMDVAAAA